MTDERRPEEGFQARARIGPHGSTRGPLAATGVIAALLVLAIVKPWNLAARPVLDLPPASPRPGAEASLRVDPSPPVESTPPAPTDPASRAPDDALVAVTDVQAQWGMRAIVQRRIPPGPLLAERWASATVPADGPPIPGAFDGIPLDRPLSDVGDAAYALGVTTPQDALPLDVRFWRASEDRGWVRLLPSPFIGREPGSWLWRPDPDWTTTDGAWPSGTYRVDVLLGARIVRLEAVVGGTGAVDPRVIEPGGLDAPIGTGLQLLPNGPFALTEWGPATIPLAGSGTYDERTAWIAPYVGAGLVAPAYGRDVNGLGLLLDVGVAAPTLLIEAVSGVPEPGLIPAAVSSVDVDGRTGLFARPLGGHLLTDGLYRIVAQWPDGRTEDWIVEVAPGIAPSLPISPLEALSRWSSRPRPARPVWPVVAVAAGDGNPTFSASCDPATRITSSDPLIGVALPADAHLTGVRVLVLGADRTTDRRFFFASAALPGLTVVAVPDGGLAARDYDLVLDLDGPDGPWRVLQRICVTD
jgi:hypothetical protein